jgi:hypothetical protein
MTHRTVNLDLAGRDGNAFFLLAAFAGQARREGWTEEEIEAVTTEAKSSNYDNLLRVLIRHCDPVESEWDEDDE